MINVASLSTMTAYSVGSNEIASYRFFGIWTFVL